MITLKQALELTGLSLSQVGEIANGLDKSTVSRISSKSYPNWQEKEREIIEALVASGKLSKADAALEILNFIEGQLRVNDNKFIITENTMALDALAKDLLEPTTTLNSSIGVVLGHAGYGKTTAIQHFCSVNDKAVYVLYCEGYSLQMLVREIVMAFRGTSNRTYDANIAALKEACAVYRKLLIIDEADRLPIKYLEALRNINEICQLPILLVGEQNLRSKMKSISRLESRIRTNPVEFKELSTLDVANFYQQAIGVEIQDAQVLSRLLYISHRDFRVMVNDAHKLVQVLNANNIHTVTKEILNAIK